MCFIFCSITISVLYVSSSYILFLISILLLWQLFLQRELLYSILLCFNILSTIPNTLLYSYCLYTVLCTILLLVCISVSFLSLICLKSFLSEMSSFSVHGCSWPFSMLSFACWVYVLLFLSLRPLTSFEEKIPSFIWLQFSWPMAAEL